MSRFFKNQGSSSSSSSSSDEDYSSSSDSEDDRLSVASEDQTFSDGDEQKPKVTKLSGAAKFMRGAASSDEESSDEDVKKVVKSTRDKRFEEMRTLAGLMNNGLKNGDWVLVQNEFDKLTKALVKAASI